MDAALQTINFLRRLTSDGYLTSDEVWSLGRFFTEHPECAAGWPGNLLSPMLESAFDDGQLSEEEMTLLAQTISSTEEEWRLKNPGERRLTAEEPPADVRVKPALIPVIDARFELPAPDDESFFVALNEHTCTCPDWKPRQALPSRHPGKCCKHVAHAFTRTGKVFEPWFQALLDDCFAHGRGTNPSHDWVLVDCPKKPALVGGGSATWWNVYAPAEEGYEPYAFNPAQRIWSYGVIPERAGLIEQAIRQQRARTTMGTMSAA